MELLLGQPTQFKTGESPNLEADLLIKINGLPGLPILIHVIFICGVILFKGQSQFTDAKIDFGIKSEYRERNEKNLKRRFKTCICNFLKNM
jgi:hypothetical protein